MTEYIFKSEISGKASWAKIYQSIEIWEPLINFILEKENLPVSKIENLSPGTNAVFKSGGYVVKIFSPIEADYGGEAEYKSESYALSFAQSHGVSVPKVIANGEIDDKYHFLYMIMKYIEGVEFNEASAKFTDDEKFAFAKRLREFTDLMNIPCEDFNGIDAIRDPCRHKRWDEYSENFKKERLEYLNTHDFGEKVLVHGDLGNDNMLIDNAGNIYIIDFADSIVAPQSYEHAYLISVLFKFDKSYLQGYFGEYKASELVDICFDGILIHDFGGWIVEEIGKTEEINCLKDLRDRLYDKIK
ncbi:MAG: phosphotransferase [Oscillospiraceae bacterium]|nr:phosphotransferase [Oscillospiraceae bacterium]